MALHGEDKKSRVEEVFGANGADNARTERVSDVDLRKYGLGISDGFLMPGEGSEYLKKFAEIVAERLDREISVGNVKTDKKVLRIDNSTRKQLPYSFVIVTATNELTDKVYYHFIALESTLSDPGLLPPRASMLVQDLEQRRRVLTLPEFITPEVIKIIRELIAAAVNVDEDKIVGTNGIMVPFDAVPEEVAVHYADVAFNNAASKLYHDTKLYEYLNMREFTHLLAQNGEFMKVDAIFNQGYAVDSVKRPIRSDVVLNLQIVKQSNPNSPLPTGGSIRYVSSDYFVDFGLQRFEDPINPLIKIVKALPTIILDDTNNIKPGPDLTLLGIAKSLPLGNPDTGYYPTLLNLPKDLGYLNVVVNGNENPSGFGKPVKLKDGKKKPEEVVAALRGLVTEIPSFGIDVVFHGKDSGINSVFADLAIPDKAAMANDAVISLAEKLCDAPFNNRNFVFSTTILPNGYYIKDGKKIDLREIDLVEVCKTGRIDLIERFINSLRPNNPAAFADRLFVINALFPDAVIEGKLARIIVNPKFLKEFEGKLKAAGFTAEPDFSHMQFTSFRDISAVAAAFAGAAYRPTGFGGYAPATPGYAGGFYGYYS